MQTARPGLCMAGVQEQTFGLTGSKTFVAYSPPFPCLTTGAEGNRRKVSSFSARDSPAQPELSFRVQSCNMEVKRLPLSLTGILEDRRQSRLGSQFMIRGRQMGRRPNPWQLPANLSKKLARDSKE